MTTPPVVSITDELIEELEAAANAAKSARPGNPWYYQEKSGAYTHIVRVDNPELNNSMIVTQLAQRTDGVSESVGRHIAITNPDNILALLSERADLKRQLAAASVDAERYRFIRGIGGPIYCREIEYYNGNPCGAHNVQNGNLDAAIDAARNIGSGD